MIIFILQSQRDMSLWLSGTQFSHNIMTSGNKIGITVSTGFINYELLQSVLDEYDIKYILAGRLHQNLNKMMKQYTQHNTRCEVRLLEPNFDVDIAARNWESIGELSIMIVNGISQDTKVTVDQLGEAGMPLRIIRY